MKLLTYLQQTRHITRREFAQMLQEQVISLNDDNVKEFDTTVKPGDTISVDLPDGQTYQEKIQDLPTIHPRLVLFHKPRGVVVSKDDPHNRTIYSLMPPRRRKNYRYIGRLDKNSTGLLLLSNDPEIVNHYQQPSSQIYKVYEVVINQPLKSNHKRQITKGLRVDRKGAKSQQSDPGAEFLSVRGLSYRRTRQGQYQLTLTLDEGKNRHIRRLLKALGYRVISLHRVKIGKRRLGSIKPGKWKVEKINKRKLLQQRSKDK